MDVGRADGRHFFGVAHAAANVGLDGDEAGNTADRFEDFIFGGFRDFEFVFGA